MRLDRTQIYSQVIGMPGVQFEQAGHYFRQDGAEVTEDGILVTAIPEPEPAAPKMPTNYDQMTPRQLKHLVESFGGEFVSREAAIKFLRGAA